MSHQVISQMISLQLVNVTNVATSLLEFTNFSVTIILHCGEWILDIVWGL